MQRSDEHESAFIEAFVIRERRDRYRSQLASRKKRPAFLDRLNHRLLDDLDPRFVCTTLAAALPDSDTSCYVIASETELDMTQVPVGDINRILASTLFGIVVSIVPGKIAAYKNEAPSDVLWLIRE